MLASVLGQRGAQGLKTPALFLLDPATLSNFLRDWIVLKNVIPNNKKR